MLKRWLLFLCIPAGAWAQQSEISPPQFQISGVARVRSEWRNNADFSDTTADSTDFLGTRFFLEMKFTPNERTFVLLQPQFTKVWGQTEFVPTGAGANTETGTSGGTRDSQIDAHQAYVRHLAHPKLGVTVGRKELNFGDQLLVGGVGWSNVGRAFDTIGLDFTHKQGSVDIFTAKVKDSNVSAAGAGDKDFSGIYSANGFGEGFNEFDIYFFLSDDASASPHFKTHAYGLRMKSPVGRFDYRFEGTYETVVTAATNSDEHQYDAEVGFQVWEGARVSAEYFYASAHFDSLYPTGHKWLGYADLFSRRNIDGFRAGIAAQVDQSLAVRLDYHQFYRADTDSPGYKLSGAPYGSAGSDRDMAAEVDLVLTYKLDLQTSLEAGAARLEPGDYMRANSMPDAATFYYVQAATKF